jgi:hypothetical protein
MFAGAISLGAALTIVVAKVLSRNKCASVMD